MSSSPILVISSFLGSSPRMLYIILHRHFPAKDLEKTISDVFRSQGEWVPHIAALLCLRIEPIVLLSFTWRESCFEHQRDSTQSVSHGRRAERTVDWSSFMFQNRPDVISSIWKETQNRYYRIFFYTGLCHFHQGRKLRIFGKSITLHLGMHRYVDFDR